MQGSTRVFYIIKYTCTAFFNKKHEKIMSATIGTTALGMLGGMANSAMGLSMGQNAAEWQNAEQRKMMRLQHELGIQAWKDTGPAALVNELKRAGLSVGLATGKGGAGGTLAQPTGNAAGVQQMDAGMERGMGLALMQAQIANTKADTAKKEAETGNVSQQTEYVTQQTIAQALENCYIS